jgi:hypothetical protein
VRSTVEQCFRATGGSGGGGSGGGGGSSGAFEAAEDQLLPADLVGISAASLTHVFNSLIGGEGAGAGAVRGRTTPAVLCVAMRDGRGNVPAIVRILYQGSSSLRESSGAYKSSGFMEAKEKDDAGAAAVAATMSAVGAALMEADQMALHLLKPFVEMAATVGSTALQFTIDRMQQHLHEGGPRGANSSSTGQRGSEQTEAQKQQQLEKIEQQANQIHKLQGELQRLQALAREVSHSQQQQQQGYTAAQMAEIEAERNATLQLLAKARKIHRAVCRDAGTLLDPPVAPVDTTTSYRGSGSGGGAAGRFKQVTPHGKGDKKGASTSSSSGMPAPTHPAALTPLAASHDTCMKVLGMLRSLLRSEGQALLLRDPGTDPVTYQVIYSGDSLHWAGIEPGSFGVVSSSRGSSVNAGGLLRVSLAETAMHSRKSIQATNAPTDPRYYAYVDGICDLGTPMLVVPMRGRGGAVVGVLIAARGRDAAPFSAEDIVAAEICSFLSALSLYWCQGMGTLHHQLALSANNAMRLEKMVQELKEKSP